jgi:2-polyprenyl-6-methoxyphenol hydroxylase-like FAD-dependent oxidoreductase
MDQTVDVIIVGSGLAGLSLARQLTLASNKRILLLEKSTQIPPSRQKVGEATVQLSGYYFSKVLDLEDHLMQEQLMKYNLRFYWKTPGSNAGSYENYSQSYIRELSNIASYQLDRNKIERELLDRLRQHPTVEVQTGIRGLSLHLSETGMHRVDYSCGPEHRSMEATWVVDTSGRSKVLSKQLGLQKKNAIRHGASFFWVDGLLNIEKLTGLSPSESRLHPHRRMTGHLPVWLATNHFMGEGFWFWVIPLHGKTSLGLVYDREKISTEDVSTPEKVIDWVCNEFPLFSRDLKTRKVLDRGMFADFSYDCLQTISAHRWAIAGEAGRFTDPLYSSGGDLIALYNTLITDCILTGDEGNLNRKVAVYEVLMRALYQAYVPSYSTSYDVLGDQECFALKYAWELTIYFAFYVFPFINDLFTNSEFSGPYLREFAKLGDLNKNLHRFITSYYGWKKTLVGTAVEPRFFDFTELQHLKSSAELFYCVGLSAADAVKILRRELCNLNQFARFIIAHIYSVVAEDPELLTDRHFIENLNPVDSVFDPELPWKRAKSGGNYLSYDWGFNPYSVACLQPEYKAKTQQPVTDLLEKSVVVAK